MDYRTLKFAMSTYNTNKIRLKKAEEDLDLILYDLANVRGVGYDQQGGSTNTLQKALNWLKKDEKYNAKEREVLYYRNLIQVVDDAKKLLPELLWNMMADKYINGMTFVEVGQKYGYSRSGCQSMLAREVEKYL